MTETPYTPSDLVDHDAISAVIKDGDGKVLMFRHQKFGFWTIPIGKAEPGETAYEGMCTELKEECGITVIKATEIATKPYTYDRHGKPIHLIHHLYIIHEYEGEITNNEPEKHPDMRFMEEKEIREQNHLSDATLLYLETLDSMPTQQGN
jgi:ADP-ribose pyrophosphatase YjhB (NUDIX family)